MELTTHHVYPLDMRHFVLLYLFEIKNKHRRAKVKIKKLTKEDKVEGKKNQHPANVLPK